MIQWSLLLLCMDWTDLHLVQVVCILEEKRKFKVSGFLVHPVQPPVAWIPPMHVLFSSQDTRVPPLLIPAGQLPEGWLQKEEAVRAKEIFCAEVCAHSIKTPGIEGY